ncbi:MULTISPECIES: hypothetical protein [Nostocales]|nr:MULTISPECIES: hypothetical protein [Nostocales]
MHKSGNTGAIAIALTHGNAPIKKPSLPHEGGGTAVGFHLHRG